MRDTRQVGMHETIAAKRSRPYVAQRNGQNCVRNSPREGTSNLSRLGEIFISYSACDAIVRSFADAFDHPQLQSAAMKQKAPFENVNIEWNLTTHDEGSTDFSDDDTVIEDRVSGDCRRTNTRVDDVNICRILDRRTDA